LASLVLRPLEDGLEFAAQLGEDLTPVGTGREDDLFDQRPQRLGGFVALFGLAERFTQPLDLAAVKLGHVRMQVRDVDRRRGELGLQRLDLGLQPLQPLHQRPGVAAVLDGADDAVDGLAGLLQPQHVAAPCGAALVVQPIALFDIGPHGLGDGLAGHEPLLQPLENPRLQPVPNDRPAIGATIAKGVVGAAKPIVRPLGDRTTTDAANDQTR
jgi:hypothetical protein